MAKQSAPQALTPVEPAPAPLQPYRATPADLLRIAIETNADMTKVEALMALHERWEAQSARKAYTAAMAAFKREPLTIVKDRHVSFDTRDGKTDYDHASLGNVVRIIVAGLARNNLSHSWITNQRDKTVSVTCRITHSDGHSEEVTLDAMPDATGGKNAIQALGSAVTYLQRYTLLSITGLAVEENDDDGAGSGPRGDAPEDPGKDTEPTPDDTEAAARKLAKRQAVHDAALGRHSESVEFIKKRIESAENWEAEASNADADEHRKRFGAMRSRDLADGAEEWSKIPADDQTALWLAPTFGGVFTTAERKVIRDEFPKHFKPTSEPTP